MLVASFLVTGDRRDSWARSLRLTPRGRTEHLLPVSVVRDLAETVAIWIVPKTDGANERLLSRSCDLGAKAPLVSRSRKAVVSPTASR